MHLTWTDSCCALPVGKEQTWILSQPDCLDIVKSPYEKMALEKVEQVYERVPPTDSSVFHEFNTHVGNDGDTWSSVTVRTASWIRKSVDMLLNFCARLCDCIITLKPVCFEHFCDTGETHGHDASLERPLKKKNFQVVTIMFKMLGTAQEVILGIF